MNSAISDLGGPNAYAGQAVYNDEMKCQQSSREGSIIPGKNTLFAGLLCSQSGPLR